MSKKKPDVKSRVMDWVARFREGYISGEMTVEEGNQLIEQLQTAPDEALTQVVALLASPEEEVRQVALTLLRELGDSRAVPPLRRMLRKPEYSDEEKMTVIQVLGDLGEELDEETIQRAITDPKGMMQRAMERMLDVIEDPVQVENFLEAMKAGPPEATALYVGEMLAPLADRRLLLLLTALLHHESDDIIVAAIDALERIKEPATVPLLEERARYDPSRKVRRAAENAALRLRARLGVPAEPPARYPWIEPATQPLAECLLSTIDGHGGQVLFVARDMPEGTMTVYDLMFNDHEGIKDCFTGIMDDDGLDDMLETFSDSIEFVDISLDRARAEVKRAYQTTLNAGRRLPPPFMAWLGWLEGEDEEPPEESPLPTLLPAQQKNLVEECVELLDLDEFAYWFFNPEEVESFMPRYEQLAQRDQAEPGDPAFDALVSEAIQAIVDEKYRRLLPDRLRRQAWLLRQIYEDDEEEIALWALAAAAALEEGMIVEHPLLRGMMEYSFYNAAR